MWRWLLEFGATVIGFTNGPLGVLLLVLAAFAGVYSLIQFGKGLWTKVEPTQLIVFGLVVGWLAFGVAIAGAIWKLYQPAIQPSEVSELQTNINKLQKIFDIYVKPRTITQAQSQMIVDYLLPREHFLIYIQYKDEDQEAKAYAGQFHSAFRESGLDARMTPVELDGKLITGGALSSGLTINYRLYRAPVVGVSRAAEILGGALKAAGVVVSGGGGGGPNPNDPKQEDITVLAIGPRPLVIHATPTQFVR